MSPQQWIAHYRVIAKLGEGGMGEVWRATDTRLGREVAIKLLPATFAAHADRLARFNREAQVLASLNHPNIAAIYGVEDRALVMELVKGPTLAERIAQGSIPLDEALQIARQIADALEAAHEKGVIHRDLKPTNVKLRPDGTVKVLDFGLAKTAESAAGDPEASPTLTISPTQAGMILGTAAYMSPEQARGKPVDTRSDIWAFGCVLYEMLTAEQAFAGESVSDILASVLKLDPNWTRLPRQTPAAIRNLLRRCLTKDRKQRLQGIGEARIAIEETIQGKQEEAPARKADHLGIVWALASLMTVAAGIALWAWLHPAPPQPGKVVRLTAGVPGIATNRPGIMAISRDGSRLAYVGGPQRQIYVRMMDQFEAKPLAGTEGAAFLCFSPDGEWISFTDESRPPKLKKIGLAGGPPNTLTEINAVIGPPTQDWGMDGYILYSDNGVLTRIPAAGGKPQILAMPDPKKNERFFMSGQCLPDRRHALAGIEHMGSAYGQNEITAFDLKTGERKVLMDRVLPLPRYMPAGLEALDGYMVFYVSSTASLMAVPFDVKRLEVTGTPVQVLDGVAGFHELPYMALSDSGTLAYLPDRPGSSQRTLVWVDRKGAEQPLGAPPRYYDDPSLSPDGQHIAVTISVEGSDIWVYDLAPGTLHRVTNARGDSSPSMWTPDGKRLVFGQSPGVVASAPADGSSAPSVLTSDEGQGRVRPTSISTDGKTLFGYFLGIARLWVLPFQENPSAPAKLQPLFESRSIKKAGPMLSPDGHWLAYRSDYSGAYEVYIEAYPGPGERKMISTDGGSYQRWSRDGRELFYTAGGKMIAVDIQTQPRLVAGAPRVLFEGKDYSSSSFDVSPDGKRFLMVKSPPKAQTAANELIVVLNWVEELRRRAPLPK